MDLEIVVTKEKKGYSAHIPSLCISTQGDSFDELVSHIHEAIELYYEEEKEHACAILQTGKFYLNMQGLLHAPYAKSLV